jgi:hypothetical protein
MIFISAPTTVIIPLSNRVDTAHVLWLNRSMASQKRNGQTIYSGSGKHGDRRTKRNRTRSAQRARAIQEQK